MEDWGKYCEEPPNEIINHDNDDLEATINMDIIQSQQNEQEQQKQKQQHKPDQRYFFQYFLHFLEQALLIDLVPDQLIKLKSDEIDVIRRRRDVFQPFQIEQLSNRIYEDLDALNQNANPKISILATTIFMNRVLRGKETSLN